MRLKVLLQPITLLLLLLTQIAWGQVKIEINGKKVMALETDATTGEVIRYELGTIEEIPEGKRLYHWGTPENSQRWLKQGHVDQGELDFLITQTEGQVAGGGFYAAGDPLSSVQFGEGVVVQETPGKIKGVVGLYPSVTDKVGLAHALRETGLSYFHYSGDWYNFIEPSAVSRVRSVSPDELLGSRFISSWKHFVKLIGAGYLDPKDPRVQTLYPKFSKLFAGEVISNSEKAQLWTQISKELYIPDFPTMLVPYFREQIVEDLAAKITDARQSGRLDLYESMIRTGRRFGIGFDELFGKFPHLPKVSLLKAQKSWTDSNIAGLDPFGQKLARTFEFIDYNDLMLEMARGAQEPWKRYDVPGQRPLLDRWIEATTPLTRSLTFKSETDYQIHLNRILREDASADIRGTPIVAGGDIMVDGKGYYRITELEKRALEENPYLILEIIPDPSAKPGQKLYLGRHEYPSARHFKKFQKMLSKPLLKDLKLAEKAGQLDSPELTRRMLREMLQNVPFQPTMLYYKDYLSIHPFTDYNGRTFRAWYRAKAKKPIFLRDFDHDLFLTKDQFLPEVINGEGQLQAIRDRMLEEFKRNPQSPKYYDIPEIWRVAVESNLIPRDPGSLVTDAKTFYLDPVNQELLRTKRLFDFDRLIKASCVSKKIQLFFEEP